MIERNRMRSSFVNVGSERRIVPIILLLLFILFLISGCGGNVPQKPIEDDMINSSPENVARTYADAVFNGNYLLMFQCFPQAFLDNVSEEDLVKFQEWENQISDSLAINRTALIGTSAVGTDLYIDDIESAMYRDLLDEISEASNLTAENITEIRTCEVQVFCETENVKKYQSVSVIVFSYADAWYVFEMENIDI